MATFLLGGLRDPLSRRLRHRHHPGRRGRLASVATGLLVATALLVNPAVPLATRDVFAAFAGSALALPDRALLVPAFVLAAVMSVTVAEVFGRPALRAASPVLLCAAWLAYAAQALAGQPQWCTVAAGAAR